MILTYGGLTDPRHLCDHKPVPTDGSVEYMDVHDARRATFNTETDAQLQPCCQAKYRKLKS